MANRLVEVQHLRKSYGEHVAIDDVSLHIDEGETLALLGPNGAGKSTTIEILEGYRVRSGGEVRVLGEDPQHAGIAWRAALGIVLQSSGEASVATVREELRGLAALYPDARAVDEVLAVVGLEEHAGRRIASLSGGQQRRVDVAMGIVGRPRLLFLDEPTTGFDAEARRGFWALIRSLQTDGTTILLTTHYLEEAAQLADRIVVIADRRVAAEGTPATIGGADARVPIVRWREGDAVREQRTREPGALVASLAARLGEPEALEVVRPSLEDVYLDIVRTDRGMVAA
ncbi:ABC transporter ATP-binding protein [Agrococcus jejuensis]|uniref:ABC-2 type transport system ATP-binding protein n=1 Tax=Agrococcus jejuensis TaxID=399736 RepID=A0A1G8HA17_9MICO|nr:ABC transporter ATP-binding protein [Agrococcus jejuensis]SDI03340.1 ABC-2 type transport system ATP-binding protein [Agrococcus jejuensis]